MYIYIYIYIYIYGLGIHGTLSAAHPNITLHAYLRPHR